ncbi:MAG: phosphatase PAP2 family protein [Tidjanibacter sp.]|nr:phosphatase PAP2 family protein [Tidjanibacter sp.]
MKRKICLFVVAMVAAIATTRGESNLLPRALTLGSEPHSTEGVWTPNALQVGEFTPLQVGTPIVAPTTPTGRPMAYWQRRDVQVGAGLLGLGAIAASADLQTRQLRQDYLPQFRYHYDDFLQFSPLVATVVLKTFGVESRSSWERMVLSSGAGVAASLAVVYAGKFGIGRLRPDGSRHNSFPSGHTAMAFSSATILHREYGHLSPWVSVAGYSVATVTGISRMLNNRHWLTDVLVGASVGILGTELGYLITDRLLGNRGLVRPEDDEWSPVSVGRNPSYVGVAMGYNLLPYNKERYERVAPSGVGFNIEGAWFFTPNVGVGAQAKVGRYADLVQRGMLGGGTIEEPQPLNSLALQGGLFYSLTLDREERWSAGAKALVGVSKNHYQRNEVVGSEGTVVGHLEHSTTEHLTATVGASVRYIAADNLGVRLFVDYNWMRTGSTFTPSEGATSASANPISFATYHTPLTIGLAFDAMLW